MNKPIMTSLIILLPYHPLWQIHKNAPRKLPKIEITCTKMEVATATAVGTLPLSTN